MVARTICVVGLGYIGLPTAVVLAQAGHRVIGVDVSGHRVDLINSGSLPFVEQGLDSALSEVVGDGSLQAQQNVPPADVYIIAVPTPIGDDHGADLSYIDEASEAIAPFLSGENLVILESTSPPGTTRRMADVILRTRPDLSVDGSTGPVVHFAHAPERVLPGNIMTELMVNDRVIGGLTPRASVLARDVYRSFCRGALLVTDAATAEMAKLAENAFRDVNIALANELSIICGELGINVWELIELANHHPRVNILQPGPGVGGHCIAVDPWFIISAAPGAARLLRTAREVNDAKPNYVVEDVKRAVSGIERPVIAMLGLTYKADVDDVRESPAVVVTATLARELPSARILAVEPHLTALPGALNELQNVEFTTLELAMSAADAIVLLVNHSDFRSITLGELNGKAVIDACGGWRSRSAAEVPIGSEVR